MSVVRIQRKKGKVVQDCDIYIGRAVYRGGWQLPKSKWANPFSVNKYGREKCLQLYKDYVLTSGLIDNIEELRGKQLGCWCHPEKCHGDVLLSLLAEREQQ